MPNPAAVWIAGPAPGAGALPWGGAAYRESLARSRASDREEARAQDLMRLLPRNRNSVLDIGARDGRFSRLLARRFSTVVALDLEQPSFECPGVTTVRGDATSLHFGDGSFDCVFCAEVIEHIPDVERACREIMRVARHEIIIGVPYRQDLRAGRATCAHCGRHNPPWGHLHSFDEAALSRLFAGWRVAARSYVGAGVDVTNALSALLMDAAGNPWGSYGQQEPCIYCGARLIPPPARRSPASRLCGALAERLNRCQRRITRPRATWIHAVFSRA